MEVQEKDKKNMNTLFHKFRIIKTPKNDSAEENSVEDTGKAIQRNETIIAEKYKEMLQIETKSPEELQAEAQQKIESIIRNIQRLQENKIGDPQRLNSIKNYLTDGYPLLHDDDIYVIERINQLEALEEEQKQSQAQKPVAEQSKPQTILIDDVEAAPTLDFISLARTISGIVRNSNPHFTIGIYGEWGTGKTTLMKAIERNLTEEGVQDKDQKILSIWFNAWKYEREENLATLSLMKTVAYALESHEKFGSVSELIFKGLTIFGKDLVQEISAKIVSQKGTGLEEVLDQKMRYVHQLYRDSVYFDGLEKIRNEMKRIRKENGNEYRVVIFIDDLDRCSPVKALEVLESMKLFLDIEGFVFIIGLSYKTVTKLISHAYKTTGVKGEDYIKKIIQIPIKIPTWTSQNIVDLIESKIVTNLNLDYTKFLLQNSKMVARVVDYNPRQLKRFINNVIIAFETFAHKTGSPTIKFNDIFLVKILKSEWPEFYSEFIHNKDFREIVRWMITRPRELRKYFRYLRTLTDELPIEQKEKRLLLLNKIIHLSEGRIDYSQIEILSEFDYDTWIFLDNVKEVLYEIEDWRVLNNVMEVVEEIPYDLPIRTKKSQDTTIPPPQPNVT
jgi:DNA replication protein DnaC